MKVKSSPLQTSRIYNPKLAPMKEFELEQYFAKYEFSVKYLLGSSDAQTISMKQLLESGTADAECAELPCALCVPSLARALDPAEAFLHARIV